MKTIIWTCIYTHIIITTHRQPCFSVFSSGDTNLISRDVGKAQRLRLTGTEELRNSKVKLTGTKEITSTEMLTSLKDLNSRSTKELTSTRELTSIKGLTGSRERTIIKELTSTSTNMLTSTRELTSMKESTNTISTRKSRWSLSRIFQTGLLHNTRYVLVTLTSQSLFFGFSLPCKCSFPLIPCSLTCQSVFFSFSLPSKCSFPLIPCSLTCYSLFFSFLSCKCSFPLIPYSLTCYSLFPHLPVRLPQPRLAE